MYGWYQSTLPIVISKSWHLGTFLYCWTWHDMIGWLFVCVCVCVCVCLSVCVSVSLSVRLSVCLILISWWQALSVCLSLCLSVYMSVCLSMHLSVVFICLSLCPLVCVFVCPSVCLCVSCWHYDDQHQVKPYLLPLKLSPLAGYLCVGYIFLSVCPFVVYEGLWCSGCLQGKLWQESGRITPMLSLEIGRLWVCLEFVGMGCVLYLRTWWLHDDDMIIVFMSNTHSHDRSRADGSLAFSADCCNSNIMWFGREILLLLFPGYFVAFFLSSSPTSPSCPSSVVFLHCMLISSPGFYSYRLAW